MIDAKNSHVRAASGPSLFDHLGRHVEDFHERDRSGGDPRGREDPIILGTEPREGKAGSAAALMDQRRVFDRLKDRFK